MAGIRIFLESGFSHDRVTLSAAGVEHEEQDVTTRHQVGLARAVDLTLPGGAPSTVRITVRDLTAEVEVTPEETPYVRVNAEGDALTVQPESFPPMYA
jgi:hypothetical protein